MMGRHAISTMHVIVSGCSSGGKSTLLAELACRGFSTVPERGRRIVEAEMQGGGRALPWIDLAAFARQAIQMARRDRADLPTASDWVFFDRSLIDAAAALQHATGEPALSALNPDARYHHQVFLAPPWPEIFLRDSARQHRLNDAVAEYARLLDAYDELGYETIIVPKVGVRERADFIIDCLDRGDIPTSNL